jgi:hypothetical protein
VGVSLLARTALLPLGIALVLVAAVQRAGWRRCSVLAVLTFAPLLIWGVYRRSLGALGYTTSLTREAIVKDLGGWPEALWIQPWRLISAANGNWGPETGWMTWTVTIAIGILVLIGVILRMRRGAVDAWYLAGYVPMILVWPFPFELGRFIVVVYPLCLLAAMDAWTWLAQRVGAAASIRDRPWMIMILVALASGPAITKFAHRASLPIDEGLLDEKRESFFFETHLDETAMRYAETFARARILAGEIPLHVPNGECVYSMMPQFVALYGRTNSLSFPHDLEDIDHAKRTLTQCRYFFLADIDILTYNIPGMYPAALIEGWTRRVLVSNINGNDTVAALLVVDAETAVSAPDSTAAAIEEEPPAADVAPASKQP